MDIHFETYNARVVSEDEYIFWHQALNHTSDVSHYNWPRAPQEAKQLVDSAASSYDEMWVESNWETGNDPVLFGKKNDQTYLLARWGTDEFPLRTEEQFVLSYRRKVENEADWVNGIFQGCFFLFEATLGIGGVMILAHNGLGFPGAAFLTIGLLLEIGRRRHKNRGMSRPLNVWEQRALEFVKHRQSACA